MQNTQLGNRQTATALPGGTTAWVRAVVAILVAILVVIGVAAAIARTIYPDDLITQIEPLRNWYFDAFAEHDPFASTRAAELARVDGRFAAHPLLTRVHVVFGGLFLLFAPLQFSATIRARNIRLHRWSGRILLPLAIVSVISSLYFGLIIPYGGAAEVAAIALFGGLFLYSIGRAYIAIRQKDTARHREWMIRMFAVALAISTVRLIGAPMDLLLTPAGLRPSAVFAITIWTGWVATVGLAELWIRRTRG